MRAHAWNYTYVSLHSRRDLYVCTRFALNKEYVHLHWKLNKCWLFYLLCRYKFVARGEPCIDHISLRMNLFHSSIMVYIYDDGAWRKGDWYKDLKCNRKKRGQKHMEYKKVGEEEQKVLCRKKKGACWCCCCCLLCVCFMRVTTTSINQDE